jgi:hypothetical protein
MTIPTRARYAGYRFPAEIIGHAVWLYFRFPNCRARPATPPPLFHGEVVLIERAAWMKRSARTRLRAT